MTQEMANGIYFSVISLFIKFLTAWVVLSIIFTALWVVVRTTQKYRVTPKPRYSVAKAKILWAIGLGSRSVDEIVAKTGLDKEDVEERLQDLVDDEVIEEF